MHHSLEGWGLPTSLFRIYICIFFPNQSQVTATDWNRSSSWKSGRACTTYLWCDPRPTRGRVPVVCVCVCLWGCQLVAHLSDWWKSRTPRRLVPYSLSLSAQGWHAGPSCPIPWLGMPEVVPEVVLCMPENISACLRVLCMHFIDFTNCTAWMSLHFYMMYLLYTPISCLYIVKCVELVL